jgi:hypothetical protein
MTFLDLVDELKDAGHQPPLAGLQYPALHIGESGEVGLDEFSERLFRGIKPPLDLFCGETQGRGVLIAESWLSGERVPKKCLPGDAVRRGAVGGQEGLRLAGAEAVPSDGIGQALLF